MKRLFALLISIFVIVTCVCSVNVFAAEETVAVDYVGNSESLIDVKNPEGPSHTTSVKTFVISAIAVEGATVTVYSLNTETNLYEKLYTEVVDENNVTTVVPLESVVGASGLYAQQINLKEGMNNILVYASKDGMDETVRFDINLLSESFLDKIKAFTVEIKTELGNIF
ncbi:MAG: hypothetical protein E7416_02795 [Ruminococcaceae bacterium]|nr:hypothetical protein [Oscillospiraceae bacterium]